MSTETLTKTTWGIDPTHSEVQFKVKHLVISTVTGYFRKFDGSIKAEDDSFEEADVQFTAEISSIDTNVADRDNHLKSDDFFNAEKYPNLSFEGTLLRSGDDYTIEGNMTIRDITKEIVLKAELGGIAEDPYGNTKAGFEISGKVSRKEFGLTWNAVTEAGNVVAGDEIKLGLNIQVVKQ